MKFYILSLLLLALCIPTTNFAQDTILPTRAATKPIKVRVKPITSLVITSPKTNTAPTAKLPTKLPVIVFSRWLSKNTVGLDINEIVLVNWNAGGASSISGLLKGNFIRLYSTETSNWINELIIRYGINKQDGITITKTDDEFRFNSTYGYRKSETSNWYHSAKFNFNTQFAYGYKYPDTSVPISKPFAPAYTFLGTGANYLNKVKKFDLYISPLTFKNTLVLDETLANKGSYGVDAATYDSEGNLLSKGKKSRTEFGFLVTNYFKKQVWENITMENRLSLYSDYLNNFGNIDVEWKVQFDLVVNKYVTANIGIHTIYDDDIKNTEIVDGKEVAIGPKLQLKQTLGIGLVYNF